MAHKLEVEVFAGKEASVNAYLFSNNNHVVVIDALRNAAEATDLAKKVKKTGKTLQAIYITHGHPDHYIGIRTLKEAFPEAKIFVASHEIKDDIIAFSTWMESVGWLEGQPQMKPKTNMNPAGFDYNLLIEVLKEDRLDLQGGGALTVRSNYPSTECAHLSTLYCPAANALFVADLCYHEVHAWAGQGVTREHIVNWVRILGDLKSEFHGTGIRVYPGHGKPGGAELFDIMRNYLDDFTSAVDAEKTNDQVLLRMKKLYPQHLQADFLLYQSILFHGPDGKKT